MIIVRNIYKKIEEFNFNNSKVLFIHCREPENINKIKEIAKESNKPCRTLLIKRSSVDNHNYGNSSDDNCDKYDYDFIFVNIFDNVIDLKLSFVSFFENISNAIDL